MRRDTTATVLQCRPPLALAPMVGLSHSALRLLILELGGIGLFFSEMLSVTRLPIENETVSPFLCRTKAESPFFYQIFVAPGQDILPAVDRLHALNAQGIDLNLGCPAPVLRKQGAGSYMSLDFIKKTVACLRQATSLPVSAKIRLGKMLDEKALVAFCRMLEDEGVDLLTVHGRLQGEKFCRKARWDWIGKVKRAVEIPVLANGGIFTVEDARKCLDQSGADGLMIGRGAVCRPWLFADIARSLYGIDIVPEPSMREIYLRFIGLLTERFFPERRLGRLKQFTYYYAQNFRFGHHLASAVQNSNSLEEASDRAAAFFDTVDRNLSS
ncbi:MAG: tRNA-dihydrouridine synthase family protein [Proteobacteria bacterium]|nr:tRNA-dihydrouridine synthase family protein [Pseudomonadota bacterium]MBU1418708.1 tRNA-dihydrouridine synthase family protein [Pseudomonadota bacterium]MBU1454454.1 tRNA-dihydrouridine synthase family protein [Pseudomonadota bacterium]